MLNYEKKRWTDVLYNGSKVTNEEQLMLMSLVGFVIWVYMLGLACPCGTKKQTYECYRYEIWGVQTNHIYPFLAAGFLFNKYFYTIQIFGILWELFEYYLHYDKAIVKWLGGCLDPAPLPNTQNYKYRANLITKGREKKYNPLDIFFGIKNSTSHGWHHSIAEIVVNIVAFLAGQQIRLYIPLKL